VMANEPLDAAENRWRRVNSLALVDQHPEEVIKVALTYAHSPMPTHL
jgi:hypothetical protein